MPAELERLPTFRSNQVTRFKKQRARASGLIPLAELASLIVEKMHGLVTTRAEVDAAYESIWQAFQNGAFRDRDRSAILFVNAGTGARRLTDEFIAGNIPFGLGREGRALWHQIFLAESFTTPAKAAEFLTSRGIDLQPRFSEQVENARRITAKRKRLLSERRKLTKPPRGPYPTVSTRVEQEMRTAFAIKGGKADVESMKDIELEARFKASASTCNAVLRRLRSERHSEP